MLTGMSSDALEENRSIRPEPVDHFSGNSPEERTAYWAAVARENALEMERKAAAGDDYASRRPWLDGHIIDWWKPDIEHLKRTGQLGLALDLAWRCMEAFEAAAFEESGPSETTYAWEAAIIARKMRNFGLELTIIERTLDVGVRTDADAARWEARQEKAEELRRRADG